MLRVEMFAQAESKRKEACMSKVTYPLYWKDLRAFENLINRLL